MSAVPVPRAVRAVLCDVDGVLRHWDDAEADLAGLERRYGLPVGAVRATAFAPSRLVPAVTGLVSEQWRAGVAAALPEHGLSTARARELVDAWSRPLGRLNESLCALLGRVRGRMPVVLVSNGTTRLERDLARLGIIARIDPVVVNSARLGRAKPDATVFRAAAAAVGERVERCLFIDDTPGHVQAAEALGMIGMCYDPGNADQADLLASLITQ